MGRAPVLCHAQRQGASSSPSVRLSTRASTSAQRPQCVQFAAHAPATPLAAQSDGNDYLQQAQSEVDRMKRNLLRYITIL